MSTATTVAIIKDILTIAALLMISRVGFAGPKPAPRRAAGVEAPRRPAETPLITRDA